MNNLLFYALLVALLYYFFIYLPQQNKPAETIKLTHSQTTQTESQPTEDQTALASTLDELIKNIRQLNQQIK